MSRILSTLELKVPPLALTAGMAFAMWLISSQWPSYLATPAWALVSALILAAVAIALCASAIWSFIASKTTVNPTTPASASFVVSSGVYRFTRNPMYLAFLLLLSAWAICLANLMSSLALPVFVLFMNRFQIKPEERALLSKFGTQYEQYLALVRRWV
jgi:protein-S-isoprenylcysteine O-methyltransferase Ste14